MAIARVTEGRLTVYAFDHLARTGARHVITTRHGGVSEGAFRSLNLGYSVGDDAGRVTANRRTVYENLGVLAGDVVTCHQVHSITVASVGDSARGRGESIAANMIPSTDALVTDRHDLYLFLRFADCVPILLCDPVRGVVGLAHAGWKGTVGDIAGATVQTMVQAFGCNPADVLAAIAPSIGPCHYLVQEDVASKARTSLPFWRDVLAPGEGGIAFDLPEANRRNLLARGLAADKIVKADVCTACRTDDFYSHRAEHGATGRFGVLIGWVGNG